MGDGVEKGPMTLPEIESQSYDIAKIIAMKRDELMKLVSQGGIEIQTLKAQEVRAVIAKLMNISASHILGKKRNSTTKVLRAIGLYVYILEQKLRMSQQEIRKHYNGEISNSTISRWVERGKEEVESNPTAKNLYDSISYIGF